MEKSEVITKFGLDPDSIGNRPRAWWIVEKIDEEEENADAQVGDLCVRTRDGGGNPICMRSLQIPNCIGTSEDGYDRTYRYYYYRMRP